MSFSSFVEMLSELLKSVVSDCSMSVAAPVLSLIGGP